MIAITNLALAIWCPLALAVASVIPAPAPVASAALPCEEAASSPSGNPTTPTNLRIIKGLDDHQGHGRSELVGGPHAEGVPGGETGPAAVWQGNNPHAYYEALASRPDCLRAFSLRNQAQIDKYRTDRYDGILSYDPQNDRHPQRQDAMKLFWPPKVVNMNQVRLPIDVTRPATGSTKVLIVSDHWWDDSWFTEWKYLYTSSSVPNGEIRPMGIWKWLNVTDNFAGGERIWFEPQMEWIGENPPTLSWFGNRGYPDVRAPTIKGGPQMRMCGKNFGSSAIGPMLNCFQARAFTWTRIWIEVEHRAGDEYAHISMWMADETQDPMPILLGAQLFSGGTSRRFYIEYNSSRSNRIGGELTAYARNVVMLKDLATPASVFAKPTK